MSINTNSSTSYIQNGSLLLQAIKTCPPEVIKSALNAIKEAVDTSSTGKSLTQSSLSPLQIPQITQLVASILREDADFLAVAETAGYGSTKEYAEKELTQALFDHASTIPDKKNMWIGPFLSPSPLMKEPTEDILSSLFTFVDSRLHLVESTEKATELGWLHTEADKAGWAEKLGSWKSNFANFKDQVQNNTKRILFSDDSKTRKKQYLTFINQIHEALFLLSLTNGDYDFYDSALPYLLAQCYTGWDERIEQLNRMASPNKGVASDFSSRVHQISRGLREDILLNRILPESIRHLNPTASTQAVNEWADDVHYKKSLKQWANEPYHLGSALQEAREPMLDILKSHFEAVSPNLMQQHYTSSSILDEIKKDYNKETEENKNFILAPILETYKEGLLNGTSPYIDPMEPLRELYKELEEIQKIDDFKQYSTALKKIRSQFLEKGFSPTFEANTPKEIARNLLSKSELSLALNRNKNLHIELEKLANIQPPMSIEEKNRLSNLITLYNQSENDDTKTTHLINQKKRIGEVLANLENKIAQDNTLLLRNFIETPQKKLQLFGASILGLSTKVLATPNPSTNETDLPNTILNWASHLPFPSALSEDFIQKITERLKTTPSFYLSLPEEVRKAPQIEALKVANPGLKFGVSLERYNLCMANPVDAFLRGEMIEAFKNDRNIVLAAVSIDGRALRFASDDLKNDRDLALTAITQNGAALVYVSDALKKSGEFGLAALSRNGMALRFTNEAIRNDRTFVLAAISQNGKALQFASTALKNKKDIVLSAVTQNGLALRFASSTLQDNKDIVLAATTQNGMALQFASKTFKNHRDVVLIAVTQNGMALQFASTALKSDKELVLSAITQNEGALQFINTVLKSSRAFLLEAASKNGLILQFIWDNFINDKDIVLKAITQNGMALEFTSTVFKNNKDFVRTAISQNGLALQFASQSLKNNGALSLTAITQNELALHYIGDDLKTNRAFLLSAVSKNGMALQFVNEPFQKDKDIVLAAVTQNEKALQFASTDLQNNRAFILEAVSKNGMALQFAGAAFKNNKVVVLAAITQNEKALQFASEALKNNKAFILAAIALNEKALQFASKNLQKDKAFVLEAVSKNGLALQFASDAFKNDKDIVLAAIAQNGKALHFANADLQNDRAFVLEAMSKNGLALQFTNKLFKNNKEIALTATAQNAKALQFASKALQSDKMVVMEALSKNGLVLEFAIDAFKNNRAVVRTAFTQNKEALAFASKALRHIWQP